MKKFTRPAFYLPIALATLLFTHPAQAWQAEEVPEGSPVKVWTEAVEGSSFKAFKGEVEIQASASKILAVIQDTEKLPQWYHNTIEAKRLKDVGANQVINYTVTKAPWPVSNRDSVTQSTTEKLADGAIKITLKGVPDAYPKQEDKIRVPRLNGFWLLQPQDNMTKVTLQISAEPGGEIPSWLANAMVIDMPNNTLSNLKTRVEK
ncbi:START domain-containing protein [uncultured Thiomicrorhabdus sp.]